jgi:hypothetical protein
MPHCKAGALAISRHPRPVFGGRARHRMRWRNMASVTLPAL